MTSVQASGAVTRAPRIDSVVAELRADPVVVRGGGDGRGDSEMFWGDTRPTDGSTRPLAFLSAGEEARRRVLLIGTGRLAAGVYEDVRREGGAQQIVGLLDSVPQTAWLGGRPDLPVLGGFDDVRTAVLDHCVDEIHVALPVRSCFDRFENFQVVAQQLGIPISFHLTVVDGVSEVYAAGQGRAVASCPVHPSRKGAMRAVKRTLDVIIAGFALLALAPLLALIALAIKATSRGPVLFRQPRIGLGRREFSMLKFRTMLDNAEQMRAAVEELNDAQGISFKVFDDPRVTRVGSWLRRSSLDELPQLLNVLRGDMSLVGPRPIPIWVAEQMRGPAYVRRFSVMQGLTGLWQIEGREQDFDRMAAQDLRYVDSWTFGLDLRILLRTLPAVWRGEGAH